MLLLLFKHIAHTLRNLSHEGNNHMDGDVAASVFRSAAMAHVGTGSFVHREHQRAQA